MTKILLIITHAPSMNTQRLAEEIYLVANEASQPINEAESDINKTLKVVQKEALTTTEDDVLQADAILLMTPENLGYMSGGMKDFFDRIYYPCLEVKQGLPVAAIIRAGNDGTGTKRALESIITGLKWRWVQAPLILKGSWDEDFITQAKELSLGMSIALQEGII